MRTGQLSELSVLHLRGVQIPLLILLLGLFCLPVSAGFSSMSSVSSVSSYSGSSSSVSSGISSGSVSSTDSSTSTSSGSGEPWIVISPVSLTMNSGKSKILTGHLGGTSDNKDVTVTIYGKEKGADTATKLDTVTTDSRGMFAWLIDGDYATLSARTGGTDGVSATVRMDGEGAVEKTPATTVTKKPTATPTSDMPVPTMLTLSASTMSPKVGQQVTFSGRLTDINRKGVRGSITAMAPDENGYGSGELTSTTSDSNGDFQFTVTTWQAGTVPVYVKYNGDNSYLPSESNTLIFMAY